VASDLKTRVDWDDDFACDSALAWEGDDPETGTRHLEEIAFEVVDKQSAQVVTEKAQSGDRGPCGGRPGGVARLKPGGRPALVWGDVRIPG
jgi:hypothetical protein